MDSTPTVCRPFRYSLLFCFLSSPVFHLPSDSSLQYVGGRQSIVCEIGAIKVLIDSLSYEDLDTASFSLLCAGNLFMIPEARQEVEHELNSCYLVSHLKIRWCACKRVYRSRYVGYMYRVALKLNWALALCWTGGGDEWCR